MGELIGPPVVSTKPSLDGVDPAVRGYLREAITWQLYQPLDSSRFGKAPILTTPQFLSARKLDLENMRLLAEQMPKSDELFVDIGVVPGGPMIPFVAATVRGELRLFHPDTTIITALKFKEDARIVYQLMKAGKNGDLAEVFFRRNKRSP